MRRRPKLEKIIRDSLAVVAVAEIEINPSGLLDDLDAAGYVVIEKATRKRDERERWYAIADLAAAKADAESAKCWGRGLAQENRQLRDRCTFLYETAAANGVSAAKLAGKWVGG